MASLCVFPVALFLVLLGSSVSVYVMAVTLNHVETFLPYISMAGSTRPESAIFGQCLNISALLALICVYLRYRFVVTHVMFGCNLKRLRILNCVALVFSCVGCVGMTIVANVQETTMQPIHQFGAFLCFWGHSIGVTINTYISYLMYPVYNSKTLVAIRIFIIFWIVIALTTLYVAGQISEKMWKDVNHYERPVTPIYYHSSEPGYFPHVLSTFSEWLLTLLLLTYFLTYSPEFGRMRVTLEVDVVEKNPSKAEEKNQLNYER